MTTRLASQFNNPELARLEGAFSKPYPATTAPVSTGGGTYRTLTAASKAAPTFASPNGAVVYDSLGNVYKSPATLEYEQSLARPQNTATGSTTTTATATGAATATSSPPSIGRQIVGGLARGLVSNVVSGVGTVAGSTIANNATGNQGLGVGASIGGFIGGTIGGFLGGTATGAATFGLGTFGGGLLGNAIGSTVGSFIGGLFDNAFGKKPTAVTPSISANFAPSPPPPFTGGQMEGVGYRIRYQWSQIDTSNGGLVVNWTDAENQLTGKILGYRILVNGVQDPFYTGAPTNGIAIVHTSGAATQYTGHGFPFPGYLIQIRNFTLARLDGQPDTGGNLGAEPIGSSPYIPTFTPAPVTEQPKPSGAFDVLEGDQQYIAGTGFRDRSKDPKVPVRTPSPNPTNAPLGTAAGLAANSLGGRGNAQPSNTATGANTAANNSPSNALTKPSFTARPYVSGVSDPSEAYDPRDVATGLTRSQLEKQYQSQLDAIQTKAQANSRAAADFDAQRINEQLNNLSNVPRQDLGGLSDREYQKQQYLKSIQGDKIREDAFNKLQTPVPTPKPKNENPTGLNLPQPDLTTVVATLAAVKLGSDALVNASLANTTKINEIAQNTTPTAQQTNAKQGVCDAMQPSQCGYEGVKAATTDATAPIAATSAANNGLLQSLIALLQGLNTFLLSNIGKIIQMLNNSVVDRTLAVMNLATGIHNAAMLTRDIGETLGGVVDNVISLTPLRFTNSEGSQVQFTDFIGSNFRAFLVSVLGVENYTSLVLNWQKANTIYHSAMGVLNTTQSMLDPISSAVEYGMENVSKIGNSLKEDGVVSENSYPAMDETIRARRVNRFERLNDTLEGAENIASNLSSVTSSAVSVKEDYKQLREDAKDLKDKATAFSTADSEARAALKAELPTEITPITLAPAPAEDEN